MRAIACCLVTVNGRMPSGTAPLSILLLTDRVCLHQWQRACRLWAVSTTTSAPQPEHLNVTIVSLLVMSTAAVVTTVPLSSPMPSLKPMIWSSESGAHRLRQNVQNSCDVDSLNATSLAPHLGQRTTSSLLPSGVSRITKPWGGVAG